MPAGKQLRTTKDTAQQAQRIAPVAEGRLQRLPWPAAALVILGICVLSWIAIIGLLR